MVIHITEENKLKQIHFLLEHMIANEWAIKLNWPDVSGVICFHKGEWTVGKYKGENFIEKISIKDNGEFSAPTSLLSGLLEAFLDDRKDIRYSFAKVIMKVVGIWIQNYGDLLSIAVLMPGRNGYIFDDGRVSLERKDW